MKEKVVENIDERIVSRQYCLFSVFSLDVRAITAWVWVPWRY